jgi:diguanylate cyclase (GGDEF)-like protein
VARLGGDEFTIILENLSSLDKAQAVIAKLMSTLGAPYEIDNVQVEGSASIGIAYFSGTDLKPDGLIKQADAALYRAKNSGRNRYCVYEPEVVAA